MGYHTRADIPFQFALAESFTICDAYHCSVMGPTWPNRMYWMTGMIDPDATQAGRSSTTGLPRRVMAGPLMPSGWKQAGVSWKVYQQEDNYGCNMLENFHGFPRRAQSPPLHTKGCARPGGTV